MAKSLETGGKQLLPCRYRVNRGAWPNVFSGTQKSIASKIVPEKDKYTKVPPPPPNTEMGVAGPKQWRLLRESERLFPKAKNKKIKKFRLKTISPTSPVKIFSSTFPGDVPPLPPYHCTDVSLLHILMLSHNVMNNLQSTKAILHSNEAIP